jgi:AraC-like DNA-binding protein
MAKKLLMNEIGDILSISEIGYNVGFRTYASFNSAFNKSVGDPPGKWQRKKSRKKSRKN